MNTGDTAFILIASALVMLMTAPGLALFYGGLVRRKNVLSVLMQCFTIMGIVSIQWVLFGYSLAFHPGEGFWGGFDWAFLNGVTGQPHDYYATTIPHQAFMIFQAMFAIITPALIIGAFAERIKFSTFIVFTLLWTTFVYDPLCHWVWAKGGWLAGLGALDFAGGTVVHIASGIAALVTAIFIGKRKSLKQGNPPHNLVLCVVGAGLLWFGWFGFNAGSALAANGLAAGAFVATHMAAAAGAITYMIIDWIINKKPTMLGLATGAVAGLVAITPAAGFVGVMPSILIGIAVSIVCFIAVAVIKPLFGYDDALDAFGVHGVGGIVGALLTGVFASKVINSAGNDGLIFGNPKLMIAQLTAVGVTIVYSFVVTFIIYKILDKTMGVRIDEHKEDVGLDLSEHHETGYTIF